MEVLGTIIGIGLILFGLYSMFKDGREKGIGYLVFEIVGIILLVTFG